MTDGGRWGSGTFHPFTDWRQLVYVGAAIAVVGIPMSVIVFGDELADSIRRCLVLAPLLAWSLATGQQEEFLENRRQAVVFVAVVGLPFTIERLPLTELNPSRLVAAVPGGLAFGLLLACVMSLVHPYLGRWTKATSRST